MTSDGDELETIFTLDDLAKVFDEYGEIEGELMGFIISHWDVDNTYNHSYASGTRVLLSPYFMMVTIYILSLFSHLFFCTVVRSCNICCYAQYVLDMDNMSLNRKFDVQKAAIMFKNYVRKEDNLVRANMVSSLSMV